MGGCGTQHRFPRDPGGVSPTFASDTRQTVLVSAVEPAVACKLAPVLLSEVGEYLESADLVRYPQMRERDLGEVQISWGEILILC